MEVARSGHFLPLGLRLGPTLPLFLLLGHRQEFQGLPDPFLPLPGRPLSRRPFPIGRFRFRMFPLLREALHLLASLFQTSFQPLPTPKGGRTRAGPHPHPVLGHPPQTNCAHRHQRGYHLGQKVVQASLVRHSEVREHVIVDGHVPPEPPVAVVLLAQTGQPAGAAHAVHGGQHPQGQQHLGIRGWPAGTAPYRLDALVES